jgi:alpha-glucosidase (family GH31 glycosyl hydrolase)
MKTSRTGIPLMRPMFMEFPQEPTLQTNETEFMFPNLLVAPKVLEFVGTYEVKLPAGVWYDFWTGKQVQGQSQLVDRFWRRCRCTWAAARFCRSNRWCRILGVPARLRI